MAASFFVDSSVQGIQVRSSLSQIHHSHHAFHRVLFRPQSVSCSTRPPNWRGTQDARRTQARHPRCGVERGEGGSGLWCQLFNHSVHLVRKKGCPLKKCR